MKLLEKFLNMKGLPINLVGTTLIEVSLFVLAIISTVGLLSYIWGSSQVIFLWLLFLSLWGFLHVKKSVTTQSRFDEIDQRDMDFKDECDRNFNELQTLKKDLKGLKSPTRADYDW